MVGNPDVISALERIADLLEVRGENAFKVRAYRTAAAQVENLGEQLRLLHAMPACERAEVAGSFRRGRERVGDLDLLVSTGRPGEVLSALAALPRAERVLLRGDTKCSIVVDGLQVDCRAVTAEQFGAAWQYFTGSQAHNIRMRGLALRMG